MTTAQGVGEHEKLITGDKLARMPDHDLCELVDGRIVPMSPTNADHGRIESNIAAALHGFARGQNLGIVLTGEVGIFTKCSPDRVRGADVVFILHAQYERRTKTRGFLEPGWNRPSRCRGGRGAVRRRPARVQPARGCRARA